ncbi:MAG: hypothetical protein Kow0080_08640 [Candidatus Promineifilaceae bacterium]
MIKVIRTSQPLISIGILWLAAAVIILVLSFMLPAKINVEWTTATELNTAGFNVYRSQQPDGEFVKINSQMIPAKGNTTTGSVYQFTDEQVKAGQTYYYVLEEIELTGSSKQYRQEMLSYTVPHISSWALIATAVSLVTGLFLLTKGIRENRE